ncbi:hypothetical protein [Jannaschia donghaensis]|uniref:Uncharacterized protein n=1 Tax=Jannaschia donghaensis TaxID=420998 RepID=A0A0M6YN13_9RHOB|nr:hypothetical protein [Jannaschia donghaensis]CTQ50913.1 hypothetical protein JDO7802_02944 [Jannaschia donghaensis]
MFNLAKLSKGAVTLAVCMALTPAVFTAGPLIESRLFAVVSGTVVTGTRVDPRGMLFNVWFRKSRPCEFIGLAWYDGDVRLRIDFHPSLPVQPVPRTRPPGGQAAGPWLLRGVESLQGTRAVTLHRCHPLWLTISEFYGH